MANTKSAEKRSRQSLARANQNRSVRTRLRTQTRPNAAVLVSASERLPGTFLCGFGIGHGIAENLRGVDARADRQNVKISILNQARGPDAILVWEESRFGPEAGASKP